MTDSVLTIEEILAAQAWDDFAGYPHTDAGRRRLLLAAHIHPDVNPDPRAGLAFEHVNTLFDQPEFSLRVAAGVRAAPGQLQWTPVSGFEDLAVRAADVSTIMRRAKQHRFFTSSASDTAGGLVTTYTEDSGGKWWFLTAFQRTGLDSRTAVWMANRLGAAIAQMAQQGWVHGDINPATVVILPSDHGLRLDGFWQSVRLGAMLDVRPTATTPPRYLAGAPADEELAVGQAAVMLADIADMDRDLADVINHHAYDPGAAQEFYRDVSTVAQRLYGKPSWHPLAEPSTPCI